MTYEQQLKAWREAMEKTMKQVLSEKDGPKNFLIRAGIVEKDGKTLTKPYRS